MSRENPETNAEWVQYIKDNIDDIDSVVIPVQQELIATDQITGLQGIRNDIGMFLHKSNGQSQLVRIDVAQQLLNEGIVSRMRIPIHLRNRKGSLERPDS